MGNKFFTSLKKECIFAEKNNKPKLFNKMPFIFM